MLLQQLDFLFRPLDLDDADSLISRFSLLRDALSVSLVVSLFAG